MTRASRNRIEAYRYDTDPRIKNLTISELTRTISADNHRVISVTQEIAQNHRVIPESTRKSKKSRQQIHKVEYPNNSEDTNSFQSKLNGFTIIFRKVIFTANTNYSTSGFSQTEKGDFFPDKSCTSERRQVNWLGNY